MSAHNLTIDFGKGQDHPDLTLHCNAPADSLCHAVYDCSCDEWNEAGVVHGKPYHRRSSEDPAHFGTWDPAECTIRDWFEGSDEATRGELTVPVAARWTGDFYEFDVTPGAES